MPLNENEKEKLRIEKLVADITTRESSTLVISTVASSFSLTILATLIAQPINVKITWGSIALLFTLLGFLYRELTIHTSEIRDYHKLRKKLTLEQANMSFPTYLRMVIVRSFLLLPMMVFFLLLDWPLVISGAVILISSLAFSMGELIRRNDC